MSIRASRWLPDALASTINTAAAFSGLSSEKVVVPLTAAAMHSPLRVDPLPRPLGHLPRHHGVIAVNEDLGIGKARAREHIRGPCLDVIAPNLRRIGDARAQGQKAHAKSCTNRSHEIES